MDLPSNLPQRSNIQGFWKLDETSGERADESGNGNNLSDYNTVGYSSSGKIDNAGDFEESNSEYLSITDGDQTGLDITGSLSISFWAKWESLENNLYPVSKWRTTTPDRSYCFQVNINGGNIIKFRTSSNGEAGGIIDITSSTTITTGTWFHIVGVFDNSNNKNIIYVDNSSDDVANNNNIYNSIAAFNIGRTDGGPVYMDGLIDEVIIWNTALTATEVSKVYNISKYKYFIPKIIIL